MPADVRGTGLHRPNSLFMTLGRLREIVAFIGGDDNTVLVVGGTQDNSFREPKIAPVDIAIKQDGQMFLARHDDERVAYDCLVLE